MDSSGTPATPRKTPFYESLGLFSVSKQRNATRVPIIENEETIHGAPCVFEQRGRAWLPGGHRGAKRKRLEQALLHKSSRLQESRLDTKTANREFVDPSLSVTLEPFARTGQPSEKLIRQRLASVVDHQNEVRRQRDPENEALLLGATPKQIRIGPEVAVAMVPCS